ncbi:MAG: 2-succinyl-5-enolpyruvyl-6-hydroxy-3-cyclohexene-1-carboxylic-acid synthase [Dehalococcoidia bacterium]
MNDTATKTPTPHALTLRSYIGAFAGELVRAGVTDVVICPGSRSTPLSMVLHEEPGLRAWIHLDERSAAFFALGLAKGSRKAVAVVGTSGTACVNFAPAVVEAYLGNVPLLVLTTDRPAELRGIGSTQTIDQLRLFGPHVKWSEELLLPESTPAAQRYVRGIADRAVTTAQAAPMGPVHLNFPFREPLIPAPREDAAPAPAPTLRTTAAVRRPDRATVQRFADELRGPRRGVIRGLMVCGGQDDPAFGAAARNLSRTLGFPLISDVLSQTRTGWDLGGLVIDNFDAMLRVPEIVAELKPQVILRFGATQISKPLATYLEHNADVRQVVIADEGMWTDPQMTASEFVFCDATAFCEDLDRALPWREESGPWIMRWVSLNAAAEAVVRSECAAEAAMTEATVFSRLPALLPERAIVYAGNSMPVRDLDSFYAAGTREVRFLCNRGASGIDGVTSSALGVAAATGRPTVLVIGDISFYHDMNGLLMAKQYGDRINLTIVVIHNDGGGIFSFLPQKTEGVANYEALWGTPHGLDFRRTAELYGLDYTRADSPDEYDDALRLSLAQRGVSIIEVRTDRDENLAAHNRIWGRVAEALR